MQTYCPSCSKEAAPDAKECAACGANFTARDGWRPTTERPLPSPNLEQELKEVVAHRIQYRKLVRSFFVNDKKWPWQATLIWFLATAWYGWLFSPLVVYRVAGVPALADLRETFKALSADALRQTAPEFLRLAGGQKAVLPLLLGQHQGRLADAGHVAAENAVGGEVHEAEASQIGALQLGLGGLVSQQRNSLLAA